MDLSQLQLMKQAALDKKAKDVICLDLKGNSDLCDYTLICSGDTDRQTRAIADSIEQTLKTKLQARPAAVEGKNSGYWILLDYGSVLVHIFHADYRKYYAIEDIWPSAVLEI